ncbi:MAG: pyruvate kinase [Planctomycetota bacterium]|nr:pyruvate kinase [Planctomycetota bacterium]
MSRLTRILATIGPASADLAPELVQAGADCIRVNLSHGDVSWHREASRRALSAGTALLLDLPGPKIRLGPFEGVRSLVRHDQVVLRPEALAVEDELPLPKEIFAGLRVGNVVAMVDGRVRCHVLEVDTDRAVLEVRRTGEVRGRQGVSLPGADLALPSFTEADARGCELAREIKPHWVAISFVCSAEDVQRVRSEVPPETKLIAKIETVRAMHRLDEIASAADALMIARGDLGAELDLPEVPAAQHRIVQSARRVGKPVVLATQVFESMHEHAVPTRAEVSDAAHGVAAGMDAVMLSGESAVGAHPISAVETLARVLSAAEEASFEAVAHAPTSPQVASVLVAARDHAWIGLGPGAVELAGPLAAARTGKHILVRAARLAGRGLMRGVHRSVDPPSVLAGRLGLDPAEGLEVEIDANGRMMLMDRRFDA